MMSTSANTNIYGNSGGLLGGSYTGISTGSSIDGYYSSPIVPEPKYPGHHCKSYDEFRNYLRESNDTPTWVKSILDGFDAADPWAAGMWAEVFQKWTNARVMEIQTTKARLGVK